MKILVLGVSGMLGSAIFRALFTYHDVWGAARSASVKSYFDESLREKILTGVDVLEHDQLVALLIENKPDVIVNCVGLVKQVPNANDSLVALPLNALFPHRLARLCELMSTRLIHISTDCVFSGNKGMYQESDVPDARDLYGLSKYLGELTEYSHCVTLRTSIIGHELSSCRSLVDWFLSQQSGVKGYTRAIFSGLPTVELARVILDYVLPNPELHGLYHLSSEPIDKYSLLLLLAEHYGKTIEIAPDDSVVIDRSLDSSRFRLATAYQPSGWPELVRLMRDSYNG